MKQPLRVLIVEDSEEDALLLLHHLRQGNFEPEHERVDTPGRLAAALAKPGWDIVLSDYRMPNFSGLDALRLVRREDPDLPFILISGIVGEEAAVTAMNQGANDFIIKAHLARLVHVVTRELREAESRRARSQAAAYGDMGREVLQILNGPDDLQDSLQRIIFVLKTQTGFDAVGLRLKEGEDFPYCAREGFSEGFLPLGNAPISSACGLVLSEKTNPADPSFTPGGSYWSNAALPPSAGPASMALVPIRNKDGIVGLVEFNDRRAGRFTLETIKLLEGIAAHIGDALLRKRTEMALKESDQRFMAILHASSDAIFIIDGNKFVDCNEAAVRLIGRPSINDLLLTHPSDISPPAQPDGSDSARKADEMIQTAFTNGFHQFEWIHRKADGEDFPAEVSLTPISMRGKTLLHCVVRDMTEHKKNALARANIQKFETLGTLAGGIAHDFNNILTAILGNLSLLQSQLAADVAGQELIQEAQDACGIAKSLSNQLLTFAKGGSPIIKVLDLRSLLTQVAGFTMRGSNARCVFDLGQRPLAVSIDKEQIAQVIQNLLINAIQAMPKGGDIVIQAATGDLDDAAFPALPAGRYVRVTFQDQGIGIPEDILPRIFDPYFSTKAVGHGLGLSMCYSIMAKHGGHITAKSRPGEGAVFILHFPVAGASDIVNERGRPELLLGSGAVLVMDDEAVVAKVLKRMLERLGYRAEAVGDGRAAIDAYRKAREAGKPYDAVILDLTASGALDGKETLAKLAALDPEVKAIVSSGYSNDPIMAEYATHGFRESLSKPYRLEQVSEVLRRIVGSGQIKK